MVLKRSLILFIIFSLFIACNNNSTSTTTTPTNSTPQVVTVELQQAQKELTELYAKIISEFKEKKTETLLKAITKETSFKSELETSKWTSDGEKIRPTIEDNLKGIKEIKEISSKVNSAKPGENSSIVLEVEFSLTGKYAVPNTPITADLITKGKSSVSWIKKDTGWIMVSWQDLGGSMSTDGNESEGSYFLGL